MEIVRGHPDGEGDGNINSSRFLLTPQYPEKLDLSFMVDIEESSITDQDAPPFRQILGSHRIHKANTSPLLPASISV